MAPRTGGREAWYRRITSQAADRLGGIRDTVMEKASVAPHHRILVVGRPAQLLTWEAHRRAHSGGVVVVADSNEERNEIESIASRTCTSSLPSSPYIEDSPLLESPRIT